MIWSINELDIDCQGVTLYNVYLAVVGRSRPSDAAASPPALGHSLEAASVRPFSVGPHAEGRRTGPESPASIRRRQLASLLHGASDQGNQSLGLMSAESRSDNARAPSLLRWISS
jgi:hypothetical protein